MENKRRTKSGESGAPENKGAENGLRDAASERRQELLRECVANIGAFLDRRKPPRILVAGNLADLRRRGIVGVAGLIRVDLTGPNGDGAHGSARNRADRRRRARKGDREP